MNGLIAYGITCVLWGCFAVMIYYNLSYPRMWYWLLLVFILNVIFAPVAVIIALIKCVVSSESL